METQDCSEAPEELQEKPASQPLVLAAHRRWHKDLGNWVKVGL